jgi:hypothetical protein
MKIALPAAGFLLALGCGAATAQTLTPEGAARIRHVIVYGADPCPPSSEDEIVVCARRPDGERYRVPENLREGVPGPEYESWAARSRNLEYVGRSGTMSCTPSGDGGWTGCWQQMMRQWREDRTINAEGQPVP